MDFESSSFLDPFLLVALQILKLLYEIKYERSLKLLINFIFDSMIKYAEYDIRKNKITFNLSLNVFDLV